LTGFSYAPRFKNLKRQRLYIFRSRQSVDRSAWKIKPAAYCDEQHIIQFWDDILRFIATIKLKETTARISSAGSIPIQSSTGCITP
jgi:TnpA family transposase